MAKDKPWAWPGGKCWQNISYLFSALVIEEQDTLWGQIKVVQLVSSGNQASDRLLQRVLHGLALRTLHSTFFKPDKQLANLPPTPSNQDFSLVQTRF